mgnify:CR=1 FL=1
MPQPSQHHPEIDTGVHVMMVIDYAAAQGYDLPVRFAGVTFRPGDHVYVDEDGVVVSHRPLA